MLHLGNKKPSTHGEEGPGVSTKHLFTPEYLDVRKSLVLVDSVKWIRLNAGRHAASAPHRGPHTLWDSIGVSRVS